MRGSDTNVGVSRSLQFQQPGPSTVEVVAAGLDRTTAGHQCLDLVPALICARVQGLEVGVLSQQQLVLLAQAIGVPVGGVGVDLIPLRELLTDRLARRGPVAGPLTLGRDVVGGAPGALKGLFGSCEFDRQRVDLGGDVTLIDVVGLLEWAPIVLDGESVGVLVQACVGDRATEARKQIGGIDADVVARRGDDVGGLGGAGVRRVDQEQLARQRIRFRFHCLRADERAAHVMQLQPAAHVGLVDESQHRCVVVVGDQQA